MKDVDSNEGFLIFKKGGHKNPRRFFHPYH
jgi:hypothetical protein